MVCLELGLINFELWLSFIARALAKMVPDRETRWAGTSSESLRKKSTTSPGQSLSHFWEMTNIVLRVATPTLKKLQTDDNC